MADDLAFYVVVIFAGLFTVLGVAALAYVD
jgi:hypothetical protein